MTDQFCRPSRGCATRRGTQTAAVVHDDYGGKWTEAVRADYLKGDLRWCFIRGAQSWSWVGGRAGAACEKQGGEQQGNQ